MSAFPFPLHRPAPLAPLRRSARSPLTLLGFGLALASALSAAESVKPAPASKPESAANPIANPSFEEREPWRGWSHVRRGSAKGSAQLATENPSAPANPQYVHFVIADPGDGYGLATTAEAPLRLEPEVTYLVRLQARADYEAFGGDLLAVLEDGDGSVLAAASLGPPHYEWRQQEARLQVSRATANGRLVILARGDGPVSLDDVSLATGPRPASRPAR